MKAARFDYERARSLAHAVQLIGGGDGFVKLLAGGQTLGPMLNLRLVQPDLLVDVSKLDETRGWSEEGDAVLIGAGVTHATIEDRKIPGPTGAVLAGIAAGIAYRAVRNRGTIGGSLAHADPAAEWGLVAATLDAELVALSRRGERIIRASDFFQGIMETALAPDELLVEASLPLLPEAARFGFAEFSQRPGDFALAMALAVLEIEGGVIADPHLGIGGAETCPRRLAAVEAALAGSAPSAAVFREAGALAAAAIEPLEDPQVDAQYRRELVAAMVARALSGACA
jgi:aerobic carbon-monoxide dehydrogenase medium subunit